MIPKSAISVCSKGRLVRTRTLPTAVLCIFLGFASAAASAWTIITQTVTTRGEYGAGSREAKEVLRWLAAHAAYNNGEAIGDFDKQGDIRVVYRATESSATVRADGVGDSPPVPLPPSGNPGDGISITWTSGGITQAWSYTWPESPAGGNWVLASYRWERSPLTQQQ